MLFVQSQPSIAADERVAHGAAVLDVLRAVAADWDETAAEVAPAYDQSMNCVVTRPKMHSPAQSSQVSTPVTCSTFVTAVAPHDGHVTVHGSLLRCCSQSHCKSNIIPTAIR